MSSSSIPADLIPSMESLSVSLLSALLPASLETLCELVLEPGVLIDQADDLELIRSALLGARGSGLSADAYGIS